MPTIRAGATAALQSLRYYQTTAWLLAVALFTGIIATFPLASLFGRAEDWLGFRPLVQPVRGGDLGLPWTMHVAGPTAGQQEAVSTLGSLLLFALAGTILAGMTTVLTLGAARAGERRGERLIQRAVGAGRRTLAASAVTEMVLVALVPLLAGSALGMLAARAELVSWPGEFSSPAGTFPLLASAVIPVIFAGVLLAPALIHPRRIAEHEVHQPLPTFPVVFQTAACLIVLSTGALLAGRARELGSTAASGSRAGTVVSISLTAGTAQQRSAQLQELLSRLQAAGFRSVSLTSPGALTGVGHVAMVLTDCGRCTENGLSMSVRLKPATHKIVSADTFRLTGIPVLSGRGITPEDDWKAPRVAVVTRSLAGREFQDGQPLGRKITTGNDDVEGSTVVGVVDDQYPLGLGGNLQPRYGVYLSVLQHPPRAVDLLIRESPGKVALQSALAAAIPPEYGTYRVTTERAVQEAAVEPVLWFGRIFRLQGWALAGLASFGIIAFMIRWVRSLQGEIAIRRSVGARRGQILRWVLGQALAVGAKGVLGGMWFGIALWSALPDLVRGTSAWDPSRLLPYAVLTGSFVVVAVLLPAWRVSRARPADLLQSSN